METTGKPVTDTRLRIELIYIKNTKIKSKNPST